MTSHIKARPLLPGGSVYPKGQQVGTCLLYPLLMTLSDLFLVLCLSAESTQGGIDFSFQFSLPFCFWGLSKYVGVNHSLEVVV